MRRWCGARASRVPGSALFARVRGTIRSPPISRRVSPPTARAGMTVSSPSAAARAWMSARSSPSCPDRHGRCGISRTSATGGPAPTRAASRRSLRRANSPPAPAPRCGPRPALVLNEATHQKKIIFHPRMMPGVVISDPELTLGLPPAITAATGSMDAVRALLRGVLCAGVSPPRRRHCARGYAADPDVSAAGMR